MAQRYWYEPILPSESTFPLSCRRTLTHFVTSISSHLSRKRTEDAFLQFITNSSSIIIVFLNELAAAYTTAGPSFTEAKEIVDYYLKQSPDSSLADVLSQQQQRKKLNMIADDILSSYLDPKAYSCSAVRDFLREVFASLVLESTVTSLSRPEFINGWIIYLLEDGESEIMHAIDAGVEGARNQGVSASKTSVDPDDSTLESTPKTSGSRSSHMDKTTEEARLEAKRLSSIMASHDRQASNSEQLPQSQPDGLSSLNADPLAKSSLNAANGTEDVNTSQLVSPSLPRDSPPVSSLSLHGAHVSVDDDLVGVEKGPMKSRPMSDYLVQVEPVSTPSSGWMVFRKYTDFQSLHEMLETVSRLNRIHSFAEQYPILPPWKGKTRQVLARDLERYLQVALKHESLAETDRMRRFLEKAGSDGAEAGGPVKPGFSFPSQSAFENMGKGMLGALSNAPKGMAGGGRAVFDGVSGVFGGVAGNGRKPAGTTARPSKADSELPVTGGTDALSRASLSDADRESSDRLNSPLPSEAESSPALVSSPSTSSFTALKEDAFKTSSVCDANDGSAQATSQDAWASVSTPGLSEGRISFESPAPSTGMDTKQDEGVPLPISGTEVEPGDSALPAHRARKQESPITTEETQIAVELIFAVINELYTLSSAWNIRRTLLNAAKSYILRPGSPTLETIRSLLQESMIDSHTSDEALGEYLSKLRENALPSQAELDAWPPPPSELEKAHLRDSARKLFVQRGIPQALTSVMGAATSREALEKIFDSLQVDTVSRGFVFSVMLQGLRVLTL